MGGYSLTLFLVHRMYCITRSREMVWRPFAHTAASQRRYKKGHAESAILDAFRTSSGCAPWSHDFKVCTIAFPEKCAESEYLQLHTGDASCESEGLACQGCI